MRGRRIGVAPLNAARLVVLIAGLALLFLGSSAALQDAGFIVAILGAVGLFISFVTPYGGGWMVGRVSFSRREANDPLADARHYVTANPEASEQVWAQERAEYTAKEERERQGGG